ncbi:phage major capsid protein [Streptomyces olivoreticuli]|uniref:phage major capsid protein n=1 Tax=Streptomyces olivoreticuli TaxID=68246 RepID=UPI002658400B|nr:phage major capsid protein [Streptomyces olivoreticuli]WKK21017.1 phage major capsid protein [Streptomyces olivoreticuli]WKK26212.1 phage major capsid protein [Streptomyces olivoreticuli]
MTKRDEYLERFRAFESDSMKRSLNRGERAAESELLDKVKEADDQIRRHLEAAAAEEQAMRVTSPLQTMGTTRPGRSTRTRMNATPGELMARSLEMSRGITTTGTSKAFSPEDTARNFIDLLAPQSVVMESGVQRVQTGAETYAFPVIRSDFSAGFVGELDDLPTGGFGAEPLKVTPKKIAAADLIANELMDDGGTAFLNPMAKSLMRSVALGFDREALIGTGAGKGFVGIANTPGIQTHTVKGGLKDLDPFVTAFGKLEAANAKTTAIMMSPKAWTALMALRESSGSLKPLLSESAGSPTAGVQRSILGVPVWLSSFVPESDILAYEADQIFAVWRKDAGFQISDQFGFLKDGTAVRAIARAAIAVPNAAAVCKITVTA